MTAKTLATAALVYASVLMPLPAFAATTAEWADRQVAVVRTTDLDLATARGRSKLNARIVSAVNRVCGTGYGFITMEERRAIAACRTEARDRAFTAANLREAQVLAKR